MRETIKEYFTFSKKERTGILVLMIIVTATAVAPAFYSPDNIEEGDSTMLQRLNDQVKVLDAGDNFPNGADSAYREPRSDYRNRQLPMNDPSQSRGYPDKKPNYGFKKQNVVMFDFDPNTITTAGWVQLGVSERTATTIDKYRSKGGRFRKAEDLLRIYGLSEQDKERLLPFVKIRNLESQIRRIKESGEVADSQPPETKHPYSSRKPADDYKPYPRKISRIIDINTADSLAWSSLPGIGPVLSQRIIKYRDRLGGFYSIEQVGEVYGLQDSVYQKIFPFLSMVAGVRKINVNEATPQLLGQHPYFRPPLARAIVDYRSQHGSFKEIEDLKQVVSITAELFNRISHYLTL